MFTELNADNLDTLLQSSKKVMVQFGAPWCGNCKITKPKFKNFAEQHDDILFVYVDAEKFPNARKHADVSNLPTFAAYSEGHLSKQLQGNKTEVIKEVLDALISH